MKPRNSGVADNKSYKDQYHFKDNFPVRVEDLPSLNTDPNINSTIKENPYASNVEIEGDEIVLQPDLSALFKAVGKKHKQGGMDVLLKPDSFIFSDDKSLGLTPEECKLFEFKQGGTYKKYTPAEVVKKNVDIKHYNKLASVLTDVHKDDIAKKTAARMLEKYISTLGNIAYAQEAKKSFPDGLPSFSQGTAPIYNKDLKENVMSQKQFAKYGGNVNSYKMKAQMGMRFFSPDTTRGPGHWETTFGVPHWVSDYADAKVLPNVNVKGYINKPGTTPKLSGLSPRLSGVPENDLIPNNKFFPNMDVNAVPTEMTESTTPQTTVPSLTPGDITGMPQGRKTADWQFTPWQKLSQLYNWGQYANAKRYMPYRSQFKATYADPSLVNPEQAIQDQAAAVNGQMGSISTLNPILRNAQASDALGQYLNRVPEIRSQYDNQNAGITNQFRQYNNQVKNNETQQNVGQDQQYYQQSIAGQQNFDNLRSYLSNQAMNNVLGDVQTNQSLAYNLMTLGPKPAYGYDFKSGDFYRNPKDIRDVYDAPQGDYLQSVLQNIDFKSLNNTEKIQLLRELQRGKALQYLNPTFNQGNGYKKGGNFNPYK